MKTELTIEESLKREKGMIFPSDMSERTLLAVSHSRLSGENCGYSRKVYFGRGLPGMWFSGSHKTLVLLELRTTDKMAGNLKF